MEVSCFTNYLLHVSRLFSNMTKLRLLSKHIFTVLFKGVNGESWILKQKISSTRIDQEYAALTALKGVVSKFRIQFTDSKFNRTQEVDATVCTKLKHILIGNS